jgi:protein TonB
LRLALTIPAPSDTPRPPLSQRATSFVLAVGVTLLIMLAMWSMNVKTPERPRFKGSVLLDFKPEPDTPDTSKKQVAAKPQPQEAQPETPTPPKAVPPPPPPPPLPLVHPYYIPLTREENVAADISRLPHAGPRSVGAQDASAGAPGDSKPIGKAPDGQPLYAAQWYREPTNAELAFYLPKNKEIRGEGVIACKTIDHHHVDDCVELGSVPSGSHLASAVRQAAWQFLVRAPRLGGKELVGTWVRITITYERGDPNKVDEGTAPTTPED